MFPTGVARVLVAAPAVIRNGSTMNGYDLRAMTGQSCDGHEHLLVTTPDFPTSSATLPLTQKQSARAVRSAVHPAPAASFARPLLRRGDDGAMFYSAASSGRRRRGIVLGPQWPRRRSLYSLRAAADRRPARQPAPAAIVGPPDAPEEADCRLSLRMRRSTAQRL